MKVNKKWIISVKIILVNKNKQALSSKKIRHNMTFLSQKLVKNNMIQINIYKVKEYIKIKTWQTAYYWLIRDLGII